MSEVLEPGRPWRNWGGTESDTPAGFARVASEAEAAAVVAAAAAAGLRVRVAGTGHSFSGIAATDGVRIDISALSGLIRYDPALLRVTLGAGTPLHEIGPILAALGWALPNMGDIDRQTLAGALSTGTHGTGLAFGGLAATLRGVRLVRADGTALEISETENARYWPAARLGLGSLGIITEMTIQCVPAFGLTVTEACENIDEVIAGFAKRCANNDHHEFFWFPHTDIAMTKTTTRVSPEATPAPPGAVSAWINDRLLGNTVFGLACALGRRIPALVPTLNRTIVRASGSRTVSGPSYATFVTDRDVPFVEMEYAVPLADLTTVLAEIRAAITAHGLRISFPVEVRVAAGDDIWLSTASGGPRAYVAVHQYRGVAYREYFDLVEAIFQRHGGRPHWGKWNTADAAYLDTVYPQLGEFRALRDELDPDRRFVNDYTERVLGLRG